MAYNGAVRIKRHNERGAAAARTAHTRTVLALSALLLSALLAGAPAAAQDQVTETLPPPSSLPLEEASPTPSGTPGNAPSPTPSETPEDAAPALVTPSATASLEPRQEITATEPPPSDGYPEPSVELRGADPVLELDATDVVTLTLTNDGSERTMSWGIQVRLSDGLTLVEDPAFEWTEKLCGNSAARWRRAVDLEPGEQASIRVGVSAVADGTQETISYTAWMVDPDGQPETVQYAHAYWGDPCDREYADHDVEVIDELTSKAERAAAIQAAVHASIAAFDLPTGLSQPQMEALVLSVAAQESGGHAFNNEMVSFDWGRGIMQITYPNSYVGAGSGGCGPDDGDCWDCRNRVDRAACYRYYTNRPAGVARNVRDGLYVLQDKHGFGYPPTWEPVDLGFGDPVTPAEMRWMFTLKRYGPNYDGVKPFYYVRELGKLLDWELVQHYGPGQPLYPGLGQKLVRAHAQLISASGSVELRTRDTGGRATGLIGGAVVGELPNAWYNQYAGRVTILFPSGPYRYEVAGTGDGSYGLQAVAEPEPLPGTYQSAFSFALAEVPIEEGAVHDYRVDWGSGGQEATRRVDSDGDDIFDAITTIHVPRAFFTAIPSAPRAGQLVTFDASGSSDPDDNIASYGWHFGDSGPSRVGPQYREFSYRYRAPGTYTVRLTVRDEHGAVDTSALRLTVREPLEPLPSLYLPLVTR
jgi:hypothetical protein